MKSTLVHIRPEESRDIVAISTVIDAAFAGMPYAEGDEAALVVELRRLNALPVSLVADRAGQVVGHIAFSPAEATDGTTGWYGLGPLAVLPRNQNAGIGSLLLEAGLAAIAGRGARGCILVGYPQLYLRAGFTVSPEHTPPGQPPEYFMLRQFWGLPVRGPIHFHPAFTPAG